VSLWGDLPWSVAAAYWVAGLLIVGGLAALLVGWVKAVRRDVGRFIRDAEANAHRITPKFTVGSDAK
jgi:hypothetical protein